MSFGNVEEFNCDVINHSSCIDGDSMIPKCLEEEVTNSLVRSVVSSEEDAFKFYNDYAFRLGFSVYKGNQKFKAACKTKHFMGLQRRVTKNNAGYLQELKDSGVSIAAGLRVLKKTTNTVSEFEFHWKSLMDKFGCHNDSCLSRLYNLREKWCPIFSKDFFSGVVLSFQRNEITNHAISKRLSKRTTLCDFYCIFDEVVSEWRSNTNMEGFCCTEEYVQMMITKSKLLKHANEVYTIRAYRLSREQFMKFLEYCQGLVVYNESEHVYKVISDKYILKRWTKDIDLSLGNSSVGNVGKVSKKDCCELNINARECAEEGFRMMKDKLASEIGPYYINNSKNEVGSSNIKDPVGKRTKRERNIRKKNIVEMKCNQARGKRKSALTHALKIKITVQLSMNNEVLERDLNFTSSECEISLGTSNNGNVEPLNGLQQFINFI
ncbi:hypothetical protein M9H77_12240 [Catharanthus roseus]|uniref:Uncharacterized protein n=1 Tax=Catharanthus roseus TaxID=4058 RepID=A0ACC0BGY6_CATRO|nr:hypothetical protein M9H77_12240 [Catharanthus roseus]